jgi:hypothetical protein
MINTTQHWYQNTCLPTSLRPNSLQEKQVVSALTQSPMCEGEIIGVILHRLWKEFGGQFINVRESLTS